MEKRKSESRRLSADLVFELGSSRVWLKKIFTGGSRLRFPFVCSACTVVDVFSPLAE